MTAPRPTGPGTPRAAWAVLSRLARKAGGPMERFLRVEAAGGIFLLVAAAAAFACSNSPWGAGFVRLWQIPVTFQLGDHTFAPSLRFLVNDGLMVAFFFVVGLEIRREATGGQLSDARRAALPAIAALGGMVAPAVIYLAIAGGPLTRRGWGVPTATDIAFAVGVLTLLGNRVPAALRILLLALAVIDDLGAILVIALFYSSGVGALGLGIAAAGVAGIGTLRLAAIRHKGAYLVPGAAVCAGIYAAGIHPTIGGVIVGLLTPARPWPGGGAPSAAGAPGDGAGPRAVTSPADALIATLHPWVAFLVMPVFALANAGVVLNGTDFDPVAVRAGVGVAVALVVGKPVGILLFTAISLRLGLARLPAGVGWRGLVVLGVVAGIGFTMAIFVAELAFTAPAPLAAAKLGVLAASGGAAAMGLLLGLVLLPRVARPLRDETEDRTGTTNP
ncbi:MAG: Na+/H+ antiporter NhaA [Bacteroidota bacterium]